jgi:membrane-bound ClpP family serine protease
MQRGSAEVFLGIGLIVLGFVGLKLTDYNYCWILVVLGSAIGSHGGISVSQRSRV